LLPFHIFQSLRQKTLIGIIFSGNISCQVLLLEYISHSLGALTYYLHITQDEI
jgi:hypothetical protein